MTATAMDTTTSERAPRNKPFSNHVENTVDFVGLAFIILCSVWLMGDVETSVCIVFGVDSVCVAVSGSVFCAAEQWQL